MKGERRRIKYGFPRLTKKERELYEEVLIDEIEIQAWYAVAYCDLLEGEVFLCIQ